MDRVSQMTVIAELLALMLILVAVLALPHLDS